MKNKFTISTLAALAVAAFAALPLSAAASDGTITFAGSVTGTTCTVSVNGGAATNAVQLPSVAAIQLATKGAVSGKTNVVISLSQCQGSATQARAFFEAGPNVDSTTFNLVNRAVSEPAGNVQIQLTDVTGAVLKVGDTSQRSSGNLASIANGAATLTYAAQYYATDAATAGNVNTSVTYSVDYL
jgi:major type 1 subunit fimbrin (pilin)